MVNHTRCCVSDCNDTSSPKRVLPVFDEKVYSIWVERIGNPSLRATDPKIAHTRYRVCDRHFSDFCRAPGSKKLKVGSLPTLHLPNFSEVPSYENSIFKHSDRKNVPLKGPNCDDNKAVPLDNLFTKLLSSKPIIEKKVSVDEIQLNLCPPVNNHIDDCQYTNDFADCATLEKLVFQQINEIQNLDMGSNIPFWEPGNFDETYLDGPKVEQVPIKGGVMPDDVPEPDLATLTPLDVQLSNKFESFKQYGF